MTNPNDTGPDTGPDDDRHTRETLAVIADHIRNGTVPTSPQPEQPTGSKA